VLKCLWKQKPLQTLSKEEFQYMLDNNFLDEACQDCAHPENKLTKSQQQQLIKEEKEKQA
jgi:hypothetical protein